ncbi:glycoprotease family-domain-containing protein [Delphinella strobiligena]|nr:glycoprotease family-domain-containing protein [Delphinella strobiligena]
MLLHLRALNSRHACHVRIRALKYKSWSFIAPRTLVTLAIETSCDDTSVAVLEKHTRSHATRTPHDHAATLHFHEKVTANTSAYNGIHPVIALESHQASLARLVQKAIKRLPHAKPDFISVTRGPGMRSNLSVGLDTAKGLSTAWQIPLVAVHHMQAHALTPRLMSALASPTTQHSTPAFPFLSLLVSGGHSMLINSTALTEHSILATTGDIALGDCLDKAARAILPKHLVMPPYGLALENFAFPAGRLDYHYTAPKNREYELERRITKHGWGLGPPLAETKGGRSSKKMAYSFSGLLSSIERFMKYDIDSATGSVTRTPRACEPSEKERCDMAKEVMRVAFEHLTSRVVLRLSSLPVQESAKVKTVVVSGGVAANTFLRHVMRSFLDIRGFQHIELCFPPVEFCTDNAAMIAWAGIEMFEAGYTSDLSVKPIKSWSMDPKSEDGGILGADGWTRSR